jgi:hypothetical protein
MEEKYVVKAHRLRAEDVGVDSGQIYRPYIGRVLIAGDWYVPARNLILAAY